MKKIAIITATRAEYGLLSPVVLKLREFESEEFKVDLVVTGTHLSESYGYTIKDIEKDGVRIDYCIKIPLNSNSEQDISNNQAETIVKFTQLFIENEYKAVVLLGDRYEMLAIAIAAGNTRTPIFHLCGGDTTEGALDEWIRHSITKMSYLHFVTNEESKRRVIQLGEHPQRVFNFGSTSIDNILKCSTLSKDEVLEHLEIDTDKKYAVCTYHPVTMEKDTVEDQVYNFLKAIRNFPEINFIVTKSNADQGGMKINEILDAEEKNISNLYVFSSLGVQRYLTLMKHAQFVIGNSSSGIIETPAFHIPTINIGDRQRGRLQSDSIVNCGTDTESIVDAVKKVQTKEFMDICANAISHYGNGNAAEKIAQKIAQVVFEENIDLKKQFFDL